MGRFSKIFSIFKTLWNPPREVLLVRSLLIGSLWIVALLTSVSIGFFVPVKQDPRLARGFSKHKEFSEGAEESGEGREPAGEKNEKSEGGENPAGLYQNPIPKSVRDRQTGRMEPGHDLNDPEIESTRSLASTLKEDVKIEKPYRYIELPEITAGTQAKGGFSVKLVATVFIEVDTYEAEKEVTDRKVEFQSLIGALISERKGDSLKRSEEMARLKQEIQREINHQLKGGQVTDVLFSQLFLL